ncbi:MAG: hypothetical protein AAF206_31880, partial [Bacteroidota bacterium]
MPDFTRCLPISFLFSLLLFVLPARIQAQCSLTVNVEVAADENCNQTNGQIIISHDGDAPFSYDWSHNTNLNDSIADNLNSGSYTVTVTDGNGCTGSQNITLSNTPLPTASLLSSTDATCNGGTDGSASISTDLNNSISWNSSPSQTTANLTGVGSGIYTATVSDSFGCSTFVTVSIGQPAPIVLSGTTEPDTCGAPNGRATVNVIASSG